MFNGCITDQYNNITKYIKLGNTKVGVLKGRKPNPT